MSTGRCLCGAVQWEVSAPLQLASACHCSICQKVHGMGSGVYGIVDSGAFHVLQGEESIESYAASALGTRRFCRSCGSIVPGAASSPGPLGIPLGSIVESDAGVAPTAHIFVASKAVWDEIGDSLPQFEAWPPGYDLPSVDTPAREPGVPGEVRGSCHCGAVAYRLTRPPMLMRHCHCSRCRLARAAPHATNLVVRLDGFEFLRGSQQLSSWKVPDAKYFTQTFCRRCSSPMPVCDAGRSIAIVPAGSLDDDPRVRPREHIWVGSKASWHAISDLLPQFSAGPPA